MKKLNLYTLLILYLAVISAPWVNSFPAAFMPALKNFSTANYHADAQNWDIDLDSYGNLLVANNAALLVFDGFHWDYVSLPGQTIVRSILYSNDRIYVGSYQEFGYFMRDDYGNFFYTSLSEHLKKTGYDFHDDDIWNIVNLPSGNILFQSFDALYTYDGAKVTTQRDNNIKPLYVFRVEDNVYSSSTDHDFYRYDNGKYHLLANGKDLGSAVVAVAQRKPEQLLLFTENNGIFILQNSQNETANALIPFSTDADNLMHRDVVNRAIQGSDGNLYIGTIRDGIVALSDNGSLLWHFNTDMGLQNNSVLSLFEDSQGNLWAGLDDGISRINLAGNLEICAPDKFSPYFGMVYGIEQTDSFNFLIASNQGLYNFNSKSGTISLVEEMNDQCWSIRNIDGSIFVANNKKSLIIHPDGTREYGYYNSTDTKKWTSAHGEEVVIQSSYYALRLFKKNSLGKWEMSHYIDGFGAPLRQIEIDNNGTIWASHLSRGIYRIQLSSDLSKVLNAQYFSQISDLDSNALCFVMKIRGEIVISSSSGLYSYNDETQEFEQYLTLNDDLGTDSQICSATTLDDSHTWIASKNFYHLLEYKNSKFHIIESISTAQLPRQNNGMNNAVYVGRDKTAYFNLNNGIGRFFHNAKHPEFLSSPELRLHDVLMVDEDNNEVPLSLEYTKNSPSCSNGNIEFRLSYPNFAESGYRYQFVLNGHGKEIVSFAEVPEMAYKELRYGEYIMSANVVNGEGRILDTVKYEFEVPKPRWLQWWAFIAYFILLAIVILLASWWYARKQVLKRKSEYEVMQALQTAKIKEQELIIADQKRRMLEAELSSKSKEMASLALNAYSKQQVIDSLKDTLSDKKSALRSASQNMADTILRKIESEDIGNREFWSVFEKNFDLIHEHFFRNLRKKFPALTDNDLKFCALLRMNLSTKDIANFTNLTIRGVETARYRLRKKLQLPESTGLGQFLTDFTA